MENLLRDLKDFWHYRKLRQKGLLSYPFEIVPKCSYLSKIKIERLFEKSRNVIIVRKETLSPDKIFDREFKTINSDVFEVNDVPNMSMNILGGKFKIEHLPFRINHKELGAQRWDGKHRIDVKAYAEKCTIDEIATPIYFDAKKLHGKQIPFYLTDKEQKKDVINAGLAFTQNGDDYVTQGTLAITHDPINLNYWHIELIFQDYHSPPIIVKNIGKSKTKEKAAKYIVDNILTALGQEHMPEGDCEISWRSYYDFNKMK